MNNCRLEEYFKDSPGELQAYTLYCRERRKHIMVDLPNMTEEDMNQRLSGEWLNMSSKEKEIYYKLSSNNKSS